MMRLKNWLLPAIMAALLITAWAIARKPATVVIKPAAVCGKGK